ncbi:MAG: response regulator transcription factor [Candidatus Magnetomorum sp.]|nr:response regulator transcription factor [Candidatus Magnetomorum sp.]
MQKQQKTAILVDDHEIVREGIKSLLVSFNDISVIGEAQNGLDAISQIDRLKPDIVFIDIMIPKLNGIKVIQKIKNSGSHTKFLVLSGHKENEYVRASFKAGADGFLSKDANYSEMKLAIKNVLNGKKHICSEISANMLNCFLNSEKSPEKDLKRDVLTKREQEILNLIADGLTNKQIASRLCISIKTVETHRSNMMKKLDLHNAAGLTSYVLQKRQAAEQFDQVAGDCLQSRSL